MEDKKKNDFSFEIVKHCGNLSEPKSSGYTKELNYVSYSGAAPKWDIREWNEDHTKMSKGITLTDEEFKNLRELLGSME